VLVSTDKAVNPTSVMAREQATSRTLGRGVRKERSICGYPSDSVTYFGSSGSGARNSSNNFEKGERLYRYARTLRHAIS